MNNLLKALVLFQYHRQAERLQLAFHEALQMMEAAVPEVWPEGPHNGQMPVTLPHMMAVSCPSYPLVLLMESVLINV